MDMMRRRLFEPLGMRSSTFRIDAALEPRLAVGYVVSRDGGISGEAPAREHDGRGYKVPNGGVYSTVHDLARVAALLSGRTGAVLLDAASLAEVMTRQTPESGTGYGLGFFIDRDDAGHTIVYHSGGVAGYNAFMVVEPQSGMAVILLRSYSPGSTNLGRAARDLLDRLIG